MVARFDSSYGVFRIEAASSEGKIMSVSRWQGTREEDQEQEQHGDIPQKVVLYEAQTFSNATTGFFDYTCDLGENYIYEVTTQLSEGGGTRTIKQYATAEENVFEDILLYDHTTNGGASIIRFNPSISSVKRNQQESITTTLGGKYPIIRRNGDVDYYSFQLGGLISFLATNEAYVNNNNRTVEERQFRQEFINSLTNGQVKLFKSGPEGLMLVRVTGVSLTPETKLGRDIYSFSATVTEVAEANIINLKNYNMFEPVNSYFKVQVSESNSNLIYFAVRG